MRRFLPVVLALALSTFAVLTTVLVFQRRPEALRFAGKLRRGLDEMLEEITELEEDTR